MSTNLAPIPERHSSLPQSVGTLGPGSPVLGAGSGPKTSPVIRYLAALNRFKWLVMILGIFGLGGGYLMSRLLPESYVVNGSFYVISQGDDGGNLLQTGSSLSNDQWREFIRGYQVITPVVVARQLFITGPLKVGGPPAPPGPSGNDAGILRGLSPDPQTFSPGRYQLKISGDGATWELGDMRTGVKYSGTVGVDSIGKEFGFHWMPVIEQRWFGGTFEFEARTPREAADDIRNTLKIDAAPRARYIYVELAGQDRFVTAGTLNDIMLESVRQALVQKKTALVQQTTMFDSVQRDSRANLAAAEQALSGFQTRTVTMPRQTLEVAPGLASTTVQGYNEYTARQSALQALRQDRADLDTALTYLRNKLPVLDRFSTIPDVANKAELISKVQELSEREGRYDELRQTLGAEYADSTMSLPVLRASIDKLRDVTIPFYARQVMARMDERIRQLSQQNTTAAQELGSVPTRQATENSLKRELAMAEEADRILTQKAYAARLAEKNTVNDLMIQDPAVPPLSPKKNRRSVIIAFGVLIGLGAGFGFAFVMDMFDKRVRYADQITGGLGLTILGVVPEIRGMKGGKSTIEEDAQVTEAFRTIRLNLAHAAPDGRLTLTISSPAPAEGKSLVSANLALSFAEAGYRTLLIDGDTRRGEQHRTFGVDRRPGLIDYLADNHPIAELLRPTSHPLLTLLPSGSRKRNAPELLGSMKMRELVATYRERYDVILIDSPPLGAGIDPFVLGTLTTNLMLVVRAGATQKDLAEAKLQIVDQLPIRLVGAVLNDVRASTHLYRYYSYSSGYAAFDEIEADAAPKLQVSSGKDEPAKGEE